MTEAFPVKDNLEKDAWIWFRVLCFGSYGASLIMADCSETEGNWRVSTKAQKYVSRFATATALSWYPGLNPYSGVESFQEVVHQTNPDKCPELGSGEQREEGMRFASSFIPGNLFEVKKLSVEII